MEGRFSSYCDTSGKGTYYVIKGLMHISQLWMKNYLCFRMVKFLLHPLLFVVFYLSMSAVICIFAAFSEYGLYRDYSTGYNP